MSGSGRPHSTGSYPSYLLTSSLVVGFDFLNYYHRLITLDELLDSSINDTKEFIDDTKKDTNKINKILNDTLDEHEMNQFFENIEKKEINEILQFQIDLEKTTYKLKQSIDEEEKKIYKRKQFIDDANDMEKFFSAGFTIDIVENLERIRKIAKELKFDVVAGKIAPATLGSNGDMEFDFVEFMNWAISKGYKLPPELEAFLTMPLSKFDEWCIKNNYSPPKRFLKARETINEQKNINESASGENVTNDTLEIKPKEKELAYTKWFRNIWYLEGKPEGSIFFDLLKKYKQKNESPILYHYINSPNGPGITLKTETTVKDHYPKIQIQKMVSRFKKEEEQKNLSSKK